MLSVNWKDKIYTLMKVWEEAASEASIRMYVNGNAELVISSAKTLQIWARKTATKKFRVAWRGTGLHIIFKIWVFYFMIHELWGWP